MLPSDTLLLVYAHQRSIALAEMLEKHLIQAFSYVRIRLYWIEFMKAIPEITIVGCGYIGKLLARQLLTKGFSVTGVVSSDASADECLQNNIACIKVDLEDLASIESADINVNNCRVIYLVPPSLHGTDDERIQHFLDVISDQQPEKFVLISTTGVYGDCKGNWIDEDTPLHPVLDRALRRADAEQRARNFCEKNNIPLVILRVPGIYGPGKLPLARIKKGVPIVRQEDSPYSNRIHAYDLVKTCEKGLIKLDITGIYNVSDSHPSTMYDYFMRVAEAAGLPAPPAISLQQAKEVLTSGMLSYMRESRRIKNEKLLTDFNMQLMFPELKSGLCSIFENKR